MYTYTMMCIDFFMIDWLFKSVISEYTFSSTQDFLDKRLKKGLFIFLFVCSLFLLVISRIFFFYLMEYIVWNISTF